MKNLFSPRVRFPVVVATLIAAMVWPEFTLAQGSADDANKSNNPLNPSPGLNFQNYYTPRLYGSDAHTNDFLLRGTLPLAPGKMIGAPQIVRVTAPISTRPQSGGGYETGLGDINLFDLFLGKLGQLEVGVGPQLTIPTATDRVLGTGKWQAGFAGVAIHPSKTGLLGGLVTWQTSFAGQSDRPDVSTLTAQPFIIHNLPEGWYLRSVGTWNFNLRSGDYYIPVGLGAGKVWKSGTTIMNLFVEPQWTVAHDGNGFPKFQVFGGLNLTLGK